VQKARLSTAAIERLVDFVVLPDFEWTTPRWLDVVLPEAGLERLAPITADNPPRMLFLVAPGSNVPLPTEAAALHMPALPDDAKVLAPWAIDDATDLFFAAQAPPEEVLTLATDSLRGVFWGLHDWAHFHSHGPFERIAETELQCDVAALVWLWDNRELLATTLAEYTRVAANVGALWHARFTAEARAFSLAPTLDYLARRTGVPRSALPRAVHG
jgi:hypothetical protein